MADVSSSVSGGTVPATTTTLTQNPLSRKLNKILERNLDNEKDTLEALEVLSSFLDKNTLHARRNLRSDLEKRSLALNEGFLKCVEELVEQVKGIQEETTTMKVCCDDMQKRLSDAKSRTSGLLKETSQLQAKNKQLEMKSKVVDAFLEKFELTQEEMQVLGDTQSQTQNSPLRENFFKVMEKVKRIHEDCKALLRTSQQRAGLEIMEAMAMHLESAYEQLYHWTQSQCRTLNTDMPEWNENLRQALKELSNRPILFQYCIDEYSIARRMALVRSFLDALTREGSTGRPIELHSHDPVRYCSDMLGWLHQAIATENDHISGLLMDQHNEKAVAILTMVTEGACRPLHVRIEHVIVSTSNSVIAYQLVNLLRYYASVLKGHLTPTAPLVQSVTDLAELQSKMFYSALNVQTSKILEGMDPPLPDLSPTSKTGELLSLLQSILSSRDMTVLASDSQEQDLKLILSSCLDPLIQLSSESVRSLHYLDRAIYMMNVLYLIQSTISLYEFTDQQVETLELQIQAHMEGVVREQCLHLLKNAKILNFHNSLKQGTVSVEHYKELEGCATQLNALISAPDQHQLPQCKLLSSARLREEVLKKSIEQFIGAYEAVYTAIADEKGSDTAQTLMPYSPERTRELFS